MKYNLTILSVLALNLGLTFAQDMQMLVAVGFPACAVSNFTNLHFHHCGPANNKTQVPCIQSGNKAAADKHGCGLMDGVCQCTTGYKTAQEVVMNCIVSTKPCGDADMASMSNHLVHSWEKNGETKMEVLGIYETDVSVATRFCILSSPILRVSSLSSSISHLWLFSSLTPRMETTNIWRNRNRRCRRESLYRQ